jgi:hypothetical protein
LIFVLFSMAPSQAATSAYAPAKARLSDACVMPVLPVTLPRQGLVLELGSGIAGRSTCYLLDLQTTEATRISVRFDRLTHEQRIVERVSRSLPPDELATLTQLLNRIWASPEALPVLEATDVSWNIWLFDGDDVRREGGRGRTGGLAKDVENYMMGLYWPGLPVQQTGGWSWFARY